MKSIPIKFYIKTNSGEYIVIWLTLELLVDETFFEREFNVFKKYNARLIKG